MKYNLD